MNGTLPTSTRSPKLDGNQMKRNTGQRERPRFSTNAPPRSDRKKEKKNSHDGNTSSLLDSESNILKDGSCLPARVGEADSLERDISISRLGELGSLVGGDERFPVEKFEDSGSSSNSLHDCVRQKSRKAGRNRQ